MVQFSKLGRDHIWNILRDMIFQMPAVADCTMKGLYKDEIIVENIAKIGKTLKSSESRLENMTIENFEAIAEMFIYIIICPDSEWFSFYKNIFNDKHLQGVP